MKRLAIALALCAAPASAQDCTAIKAAASDLAANAQDVLRITSEAGAVAGSASLSASLRNDPEAAKTFGAIADSATEATRAQTRAMQAAKSLIDASGC